MNRWLGNIVHAAGRRRDRNRPVIVALLVGSGLADLAKRRGRTHSQGKTSEDESKGNKGDSMNVNRRQVILVGSLAVAAAIFAALFMSACGGSGASSSTPTPSGKSPTAQSTGTAGQSPCPPSGAATSLTGAGASFPYPLYSKWTSQFDKLCGVQINYQSVGSGAGISQITQKTVDFGASDGIMTDEQIKAAEAAGGPILHIPMTSGAVAVIINLPSVNQGQLKLTPDVLANIYLKNIKKWNDQAITSINPGIDLPSSDIAVVHRSDGSGTTYIFTNYLSKVSSEWESKVGNATTVQWPGDIGGEKNDGVAQQVKQIPGAIGYVELAYAMQNNLTWASMQNKSGNYVEPTLESTTAASTGVTIPDDTKVMITDSSNPQAYPIVGFTWVLAYVNQPDRAKGESLVYYLWWSIHDGQQYSKDLLYAPLPSDVVKKAEAEIKSVSYQGQPLLQLP
jgi:phosphate transport system substrate-binding protein